MQYDVFISYRREGGFDTAKHLNDLLVRDGYMVSFDIDTLRSGNFDTQLLDRIDQCQDFILIVDQHAFDRTLDPNFNPKMDWLRCELSYALRKQKNIVPVFLAKVNGFPEGLPSDVVNVIKKNGPEYNRYYFNDFYEKLKSSFLISKPHKKTNKFFILMIVLGLILGSVVFFGGRELLNYTNGVNNVTKVASFEKITPEINYTDAKKLFINVAGVNPVYAVSYTEDTPILIGIVNKNVLDGDEPDSKSIVNPKLSLVRYYNENGIWIKDFEKELIFDRIINIEDANLFCELDDIPELYSASQQIYLYFHLYRYCGGTASADVIHDFIAINLMKGMYHFLEYVENLDSHYSDNGTLIKEKSYPRGIEDLLTNRFEKMGGLQKINNKM